MQFIFYFVLLDNKNDIACFTYIKGLIDSNGDFSNHPRRELYETPTQRMLHGAAYTPLWILQTPLKGDHAQPPLEEVAWWLHKTPCERVAMGLHITPYE